MKQVECNKCEKVFEVEGEWGYCPFCENDNVEVKKEQCCVGIVEHEKVTMLKHDYDAMVEREEKFRNQLLNVQMVSAKEINKLHKELALTEKALELAVEQLDDAKDMLRECGKHDWAGMIDTSADYFKTKAKEMMKSE